MEQAGLLIFTCERRHLTLSTAGCARLYASANQPKAPSLYEGRAACRACPIGAFNHTGKTPDPVALLTEALHDVCCRCLRRSSRLIWGMLCASCDARQREAVRRRNAKGSVPALSARLHIERVAVASNGRVHVVSRNAAASLAEVIIHAVKGATGPLSFGRPPHVAA